MAKPEENRRTVKDRRQSPTRPFGRYVLAGRRHSVRRSADRRTHLYVDRYSHNLLLILLIIVLLSIFDAYFTIMHVERGAREINPFMDFLIGYGDLYFFAVKYILTALGVFLLCLYKNLLLVRILIGFLILLYLTVFGHHILLTFLN